jgi:predicted ribosome quality control (RQC) complex YloA/Tae2 family protein
MDNLILMRVAQVLGRELERGVLEDVGAEGLHRFRFAFRTERSAAAVVVSLRPELPWIGRPGRRRRSTRRREEPFAALCRRTLGGAVLRSVEKPLSDRSVVFRFGDGHAVVAELATHGANLVLLGHGDQVMAAARRPKAARERLEPGRSYGTRPPPRGRLDPFAADAALVDRLLERGMREGDSPVESIRRRLFGIGTAASELVAAEARTSGRSPGTVLIERLRALEKGLLDPVLVGAVGADAAPPAEEIDVEAVRLLPWEPPGSVGALRLHDAAATAGLYYEAADAATEIRERLDALRSILDNEIERLLSVENKVSADLRGFEDPDRFRRWGEALLAGLGAAERFGEQVRVPDPYDPDSRLVVPAPGGLSLTQAADAHFKAHRRARRGREAARRRLGEVSARRARLERLRGVNVVGDDRAAEAGRLEESMRAERIPVGLVRPRRRREAPVSRVRVEGVRMFTGAEGETILVGKTGPANDRLTFKLAAPEDFWLHAHGRPGAHVVIRNPDGRAKPARGTLEQAAVLAAWFSSGREDSGVEVHWTRRKHVRRLRGAPPGTVTLKRFETVRVRPAPPPEE